MYTCTVYTSLFSATGKKTNTVCTTFLAEFFFLSWFWTARTTYIHSAFEQLVLHTYIALLNSSDFIHTSRFRTAQTTYIHCAFEQIGLHIHTSCSWTARTTYIHRAFEQVGQHIHTSRSWTARTTYIHRAFEQLGLHTVHRTFSWLGHAVAESVNKCT